LYVESLSGGNPGISMNELWTTILKIETKTGVDNINMNVLKYAFTTVGETLADMINQSFDEGVFPSAFKTSTVIPIQKVPKTIKSYKFRKSKVCGKRPIVSLY
jgi:hypothetical protein